MNDDPVEQVVSLSGVTFTWPGSGHPMVNVMDMALARGEHIFLFGPSGSGKSTLLNLLAGIAHPTAGRVSILDQDMARLRWWRRDRFRARHIGVIFQQFNLIPYLSVEDNVLLARHFAHNRARQDHERAQEMLERLGLDGSVLDRKAGSLSVGQQQRVAVARALINEPELILADEPTSALDSEARDDFMALLKAEAARCQSALVFVSHDRALGEHFGEHLDVRAVMHWREVA